MRAGAVVACERVLVAIRRHAQEALRDRTVGEGDGEEAKGKAEGKSGSGDGGEAETKEGEEKRRLRLEAFLAHLNEAELDEYLWTKGKEEGFRKLRRHYTRGTYYY